MDDGTRRMRRTPRRSERSGEGTLARSRTPRVSRRAFLKTAGAATLSVAALGMAPGLLRSAEADPSYFFPNNLWDTAWALATSPQSVVNTYLAARKAQGFDTVMMGYGGVGTRNRVLGNGQAPFLATIPFPSAGDPVADLTRPNPAGWSYVDSVINKAASLGLWIAFLPLGNGSEYRYVAALRNGSVAFHYGRWVGNRYKNVARFIWVLGGDVDPTFDGVFNLTNRLAAGLLAAGVRQPITFEGSADQSSSEVFHRQSWLTFNGIQSEWPYALIPDDLALTPRKPTGVLEMGYEGYFTASEIYDATLASYQAGASYVTYGLWDMYNGTNPSLTPGIRAVRDARDRAAALARRRLTQSSNS